MAVNEMPWVAINYEDPKGWQLKTKLNCISIPYFVLLTKFGSVACDNGYTLVSSIGCGIFEYLDYK